MFSKFNEALLKLWVRFSDEDGQALAEYGLILGLIAVVCIIALTGIGLAVSGQLGQVSSALGGSYQFSPKLLGGFELLHEVEYEDWSDWGDHVLYLGPNLSYRPGEWWTTITALTQVTDVDAEPDFQLRLIFGFDF